MISDLGPVFRNAFTFKVNLHALSLPAYQFLACNRSDCGALAEPATRYQLA